MNYDPDAFGDDPTPEPTLHDLIRDASDKVIKAERRARRCRRRFRRLKATEDGQPVSAAERIEKRTARWRNCWDGLYGDGSWDKATAEMKDPFGVYTCSGGMVVSMWAYDAAAHFTTFDSVAYAEDGLRESKLVNGDKGRLN